MQDQNHDPKSPPNEKTQLGDSVEVVLRDKFGNIKEVRKAKCKKI